MSSVAYMQQTPTRQPKANLCDFVMTSLSLDPKPINVLSCYHRFAYPCQPFFFFLGGGGGRSLVAATWGPGTGVEILRKLLGSGTVEDSPKWGMGGGGGAANSA